MLLTPWLFDPWFLPLVSQVLQGRLGKKWSETIEWMDEHFLWGHHQRKERGQHMPLQPLSWSLHFLQVELMHALLWNHKKAIGLVFFSPPYPELASVNDKFIYPVTWQNQCAFWDEDDSMINYLNKTKSLAVHTFSQVKDNLNIATANENVAAMKLFKEACPVFYNHKRKWHSDDSNFPAKLLTRNIRIISSRNLLLWNGRFLELFCKTIFLRNC